MSTGPTNAVLSEHLMRIARDPELRQAAYERLGEYCHQCRNRLNSLKLSLYLTIKQLHGPTTGQWDALQEHYQELERRVERLQALCRPMVLSRVNLGLELLFEDRRDLWTRMMASGPGESGLEMIAPPTRAVASFDVERLGQALDSLVAWRSTGDVTGRRARLRWWVQGDRAHVSWEEPGNDPARSPDPSPWTLPILVRVAEAHGGDCSVGEAFGWRVVLSWPAGTRTA